jgi:hypothetical protein
MSQVTEHNGRQSSDLHSVLTDTSGLAVSINAESWRTQLGDFTTHPRNDLCRKCRLMSLERASSLNSADSDISVDEPSGTDMDYIRALLKCLRQSLWGHGASAKLRRN